MSLFFQVPHFLRSELHCFGAVQRVARQARGTTGALIDDIKVNDTGYDLNPVPVSRMKKNIMLLTCLTDCDLVCISDDDELCERGTTHTPQ